jgi:hypothetical protein
MLAMRVLLVAALATCQRPPTPATDDDCAQAEARVFALQCRTDTGVPLWQTPAGASFRDACRAALADAPRRDWHPACIARLESCADLNRVVAGGCQ